MMRNKKLYRKLRLVCVCVCSYIAREMNRDARTVSKAVKNENFTGKPRSNKEKSMFTDRNIKKKKIKCLVNSHVETSGNELADGMVKGSFRLSYTTQISISANNIYHRINAVQIFMDLLF